MKLDTKHLTLREYTPEDADALYPVLSDAETMSFWPKPLSMDNVRAWIDRSIRSYSENGFGRYAVVLKETGELIGDCGIVRSELDGQAVIDLGYIIHKNHWKKGYATEAARAVIDFAFSTLNLSTLHANMPHDHHASRKVAEKLGFTRVKEFNNERNRGIKTFLYELRRS